MYQKQTNPAALRSQHLISAALLQLMQTESFSGISITHICHQAGIGRKTFYRNFETKEDVIDFQLDQLIDRYRGQMLQIPEPERLRHFYAFFQQQMRYINLLYENQLIDRMIQRLSDCMHAILPRFSADEVEQAYRCAQIIGSLEAIFSLWAARGFQENLTQVMQFTEQALACLDTTTVRE